MKIRKYIKAADTLGGDAIESMETPMVDSFDFGKDDLQNRLENIQDTVEDIQDTVENIEQDDINIEVENNIAGHYIAECDRCNGIFISALCESEAKTDSLHGICPLCDKESDQHLKWVIKSIE